MMILRFLRCSCGGVGFVQDALPLLVSRPVLDFLAFARSSRVTITPDVTLPRSNVYQNPSPEAIVTGGRLRTRRARN